MSKLFDRECDRTFKLGIAIQVHAHRLFLACLALAQVVLFEQLAHHVVARWRAHVSQVAADLAS
jgi:hypothetical protein